ncbi:MAG: hypothetical protein ACKO1U_04480, partial [Bacteroidota bacterium]
EAIPNYPDANLPTVLLYKDSKCLQTIVGLRQFGGQSTSPELVRQRNGSSMRSFNVSTLC